MKYVSLQQIKEALALLRSHHALFATTFLVMKRARVPIGRKARFVLDAANNEFLETFYRVHPKSKYFFRVLRQGNPGKDWNEPDYAAKGLQSVNTRGCPDAFLHDKNDTTWGWSHNYIKALSAKLPRGVKVPIYCLGAWLYRDHGWPDDATRLTIVREFIKDYALTPDELDSLFSKEIVSSFSESEAFQDTPAKWHQILAGFSTPPDAPPDSSGILNYLETHGIGPASKFAFNAASRLNIITGDNGLGKTFLLDLSWWALTQQWLEGQVLPSSTKTPASIRFSLSGASEGGIIDIPFDRQTLRWRTPSRLPTVSGLVIYARVDGSFAVWDPVNTTASKAGPIGQQPALILTREQVLNGDKHIEGLIHDWVRWQERPDKYPAFETFQKVLSRVSPPDFGEMKIGPTTRLAGDRREIPTLIHKHGTTPFVHESAGIKRIVTLAYLIVWAWEEHKLQAKQRGMKEERQMVVIVDEVEAHLHPKWQRVILPSLLGIAADLHAELSLQLIVATHSPLVLASSEPVFDSSKDRLFHLDSNDGKVSLNETPFESRGTVDSWLSSSVFNLKQPGSQSREVLINEAIELQESESPPKKDIQQLHNRLKSALAAEDPFWVRWIFFAESNGIKL